jgi:hypothetical protein
MILLSSEIAVGHCVIINHVEQPCAKLLAVITSFDENTVTTNYLNADKSFNSYNKVGCANRKSEVTPVGLFGVQVMVDLEKNEYSCQFIADSIAEYHDGRIRKWQDYNNCLYQFRPKVLKIAAKAVKRKALEDAGWKFGDAADFLDDITNCN